jgi:hypothetical protein
MMIRTLSHRAFLAAGVFALLGLAGCGGIIGPTVLVTDLQLEPGGTGTLLLQVFHLPGLQVVQVGPGGRLTFDPQVIQVQNLKGTNGFEVYASSIDNAQGEVVFLLGYPGGSVTTGAVLELAVKAVGKLGSGTAVTLAGIDLLADAAGNLISQYELRAGQVRIVSILEFE